ncbi:MAG: hypothetical protein BLITH_0325 [Brockia lithotrophica]|uniref:Uncharacterized protein n=1 Tax=Brockia lithotrophica TaxID=933949 RepID=A0A2T5GAN1_9BACL|nr:hypothetical protein [Brockia lithotrophica]PTQ53245.1 MAG: hypothetical protein BLITH_0325 [Brockia lithotrophica]
MVLPCRKTAPPCDRGGALLVVLLFFLLFVTAGLVLLAAVGHAGMLGTKEEEFSRAESAAEDGLAWFDRALNAELSGLGNVYPDTAEARIREAVARIAPPPEMGTRYETDLRPASAGNGPQSYLLTVTSTGNVRGSEVSLTRTYLLTTVAEQFLYAFVTDGDLTLNGAPYVVGDVLVGGKLTTSPYAQYIWGKQRDHLVGYGAVRGSLSTPRTDFVLVDERKSQTVLPLTSDNLARGFAQPPTLAPSRAKAVPLDVRGEVARARANVPPTADMAVLSCPLWSYTCEITKSAAYGKGLWVRGNLHVRGNGTKVVVGGNLLVDGTLTVDAGASLEVRGSVAYVKNGADVRGKVELSPGGAAYVGGKLAATDAYLQGTFFVAGDVTLLEHLYGRSTIYTGGAGEVHEFEMQKDSFLVLLAEGPVRVYNNNLFQDVPLVVYAYLYSNADLTLYGVGSHLELHGGIAGKNVTLNVAKGKTRDGGTDVSFEEPQTGISPERSRLKIFYDESMILHPPEGIDRPGPIRAKVLSTRYGR